MRAPRSLLQRVARASALPLVLAAATALGGCGGGAPAGARNLLLVSIDTLRADALGCYGSTRGASPEIDRFAERCVRFSNAWSHSPKTAPSHMSLLTGLPPRVHGVGNLNTAGGQTLGSGAVTLAETLRARGFATGGFTSGGNVKGVLGFARGFDVYEDHGMRMEQKLPEVRRWLKELDPDRRWFLFFHTYQVHDPYFVSPALVARFTDPDYAGRIVGVRDRLLAEMQAGEDLAPELSGDERIVANFWYRVNPDDPADVRQLHDLYTAGVADMDATLGRFLGWLDEQGSMEDTVVVITADHGEEFGEHGHTKHDQLWREVLHVPLLVRLPGDRGAGRVIDAPVRHIDFVPTMLELLDVADSDAGSGAEPLRLGRSWASWIDDGPPTSGPDAEPRLLFAEHRSKRGASLDLWSVRSEGWLLHQDREGQTLRDLARDPDELEPAEDAAQRARLLGIARRRLAELTELALGLGGGAGIELDPATRAELEALGYLGPEEDAGRGGGPVEHGRDASGSEPGGGD